MTDFVYDHFGSKVWYDLKSWNHQPLNANIIWFIIDFPNQPKYWVRLHREDGPAVIFDDASEYYCINGKFHCEQGPSKIWGNRETEWHLNSRKYSFEDWCKELDKSEEEINFLRLKWNI